MTMGTTTTPSRVQTTTAAAALAAIGIATAATSYWWLSRRRRRRFKKQNLRIVSLCPSTTETLYDLGLSHYVVGRTRYCPKPSKEKEGSSSSSSSVPPAPAPKKMGGTKDPDWDAIRKLKPTHILFNMEENDYTHLSKAQSICETVVHTPTTIAESIDMILALGEIFETTQEAKRIAKDIQTSLAHLQAKQTQESNKFTFLYFIWHTPDQRLASKNTYIDAMLSAAGGTNLATQINDERYPLMPPDFDATADYCLLSTEPFPYKESHIPDYQKFGKTCRIIDGEMLAWHGSRSAAGLRYLIDYFDKQS